MTQRDSIDDLVDHFRTDLHRAEQQADRTRRPLRLRRIVLAGGGLAIAGTAAALVIGIGGGSKLDVIAQARAALAPKGELVHLVAAFAPNGKPDDPSRQTDVQQIWSDPSSGRWRISNTYQEGTWDPKRKMSLPNGKYTTQQFAYADETQFSYEQYDNTYTTISGHSYVVSAPSWPGLPSGQDPVEGIRAMLASGRLRDVGSAELFGRRVVRLRGMSEASNARQFGGEQPAVPVELDLDPTTYEPVRLVVTDVMIDHGKTTTTSSNLWFRTVEQLPLTPANEALLSIAVPAGAKIRHYVERVKGQPCKPVAHLDDLCQA